MLSVPRNSGRSPLWRQPIAALTILVLCVTLVVGLAWLVLHEIETLTSSNSDNLQWSLAQAEVDFLRYEAALVQAEASIGEGDADTTGAAIVALRRAFDIFYSRMTLIEEASAFRDMQDKQDFNAPRQRVDAFLQETVPLIDGSAPALLAALPDLRESADRIHQDVRSFSLSGLDGFAQITDARRASLIRTLGLIATVLFLFIAGLSLLALVLVRMARQSRESASRAEAHAARMHTIVETSLDAVVVTDSDGFIHEFNSTAERMFGYSRAEVVGRRVRHLLVPEAEAEELRRMGDSVLEARERGDSFLHPFEFTARDRSGRRFPAEVSFDRAADNEHLFVSFVRDISLRKAQEEMLTQARDRALAGERSKSEFLAVMSHEMRTPLNGLIGSMQLLRDHSLSEEQSELLTLMDSSAQLLLNLVNDVLDLAKFEAGKMKPEARTFSVPRLLDGVVETSATLAATNGNDLTWNWVGTPSGPLVADARRLRQVLLNLVTNAVKFTRGGDVEIEVELVGPQRSQIEFRVIDSGIGIAENDLDRIFNDFETLDSSYARQASGTGLGLGIARRLVQLMEGEIGAESVPGDGSLFWVRIPVAQAAGDETLPDPETVGTTNGTTPPMEILLVEDNEINRFIAREMLESEGHYVTEAVDGQAGVDWADAQRFDLILMDISMPVMDGTEAALRIRSGHGASADVPIVALTAHALPEELKKFRSIGMDHCLSKPIDRKVLSRLLQDLANGVLPLATQDSRDRAAPSELIDATQIETLFSGTGAETARKLLDRFCAETDGCIAALAAFPGSKQEIARLTHACAGTCGTFGLIALREALAAIETKAKRGQEIEAAELQALEPLWKASRAELETFDTRGVDA